MPWFKVDDGFNNHRKVRSIPRAQRAAAIGLWTLAGSWSAENLTDGFVPEYMLAELGCTRGQAAALVQAALWARVDGGYAFHEWEGHQPSREQVEERRAKTAERVARWRATRASSSQHDEDVGNGVTDGVTNGVSNAAPVPDPTRPDPITTSAPTERAKPPASPRRARAKQPSLDGIPETEPALNGGALVAEWIRSCNRRPPDNVVGQIAKHVGAFLEEGFSAEDIREAITRWKAKNLSPSTLPSILNEVVNPGEGNVRVLRGGKPIDYAPPGHVEAPANDPFAAALAAKEGA